MSEHSMCKKILLSGQAGFRVHYCETHHTVELEIGAMSLRLDEDALEMMSDSLAESVSKLHVLQATKGSFEAFMRQLKNA
jgi:Zn finger protein HypA/HybF involved in hydrogenase expression